MVDDYSNPYSNAVQAQASVLAGYASNAARSQPMRDRLQDATKRAGNIVGMLSTLTSAVLPPSPLAGAKSTGEEYLNDSTLSGDLDDLIRMIGRIEGQVSHLSIAITGAA